MSYFFEIRFLLSKLTLVARSSPAAAAIAYGFAGMMIWHLCIVLKSGCGLWWVKTQFDVTGVTSEAHMMD
jgi:hypothetical protein